MTCDAEVRVSSVDAGRLGSIIYIDIYKCNGNACIFFSFLLADSSYYTLDAYTILHP